MNFGQRIVAADLVRTSQTLPAFAVPVYRRFHSLIVHRIHRASCRSNQQKHASCWYQALNHLYLAKAHFLCYYNSTNRHLFTSAQYFQTMAHSALTSNYDDRGLSPASQKEALERLHNIQVKICEFSQSSKSEKEPLLIAVSKLKSPQLIYYFYESGVRHFGENYVQELVDKAAQLPHDIKWHFIGHLQSNKCKLLVESCPNLYLVETVDSKKLASKLQTAVNLSNRSDQLKVLVQVKTTEEETKSGLSSDPKHVVGLVRHIVENCPALQFCGLMTVGHVDTVKAAECFETLAGLKKCVLDEVQQCRDFFTDQVFELSMGMTNDMKLAIEKGSTEVRVGTALFGHREAADTKSGA